MGLKSVLFSGILLSVMAVGVQAKPETGSGLDKSSLPQPVYSPEPGLVGSLGFGLGAGEASGRDSPVALYG